MDAWLKVLLVILVIGALLYPLHRTLLWMDGRGWIFYKTSGNSSAANAILSVQSIFEPAVQHLAETKQHLEIEAETQKWKLPGPVPKD